MTNTIAKIPAHPRIKYNNCQDTLSNRNIILIIMAIATPITQRAMRFNLKFAGVLYNDSVKFEVVQPWLSR